jgi:hypothetical protein
LAPIGPDKIIAMVTFKISLIQVRGNLPGKLVGFRKPLSPKNAPEYLLDPGPGCLRLDALIRDGKNIYREPGTITKGKELVFIPDSQVIAERMALSRSLLDNIYADPELMAVSDKLIAELRNQLGIDLLNDAGFHHN